ncbi:hypothetical protein Hbl1158_13260 [Halobaculum sp. CBA1158]|uniref:hypothetical protein n=1 Tax=Halobaculum sp. CBA1158 TaxID=2904243 RepID=UPI001F46693F|nr:hypothetical protein [Halobaculum sp. CBA1158]UIO99480.1 hypothetical protein Hbl1158_13260 [Halobaculum sp. CBA1158]
MSLRHVGATTFAAGLFVCVVSAVTVGVAWGGTDAFCPGARRLTEYAILGIEGVPPTVRYTDGCNEFALSPAVQWSGLATVVGLALAAVGQAAAE